MKDMPKPMQLFITILGETVPLAQIKQSYYSTAAQKSEVQGYVSQIKDESAAK